MLHLGNQVQVLRLMVSQTISHYLLSSSIFITFEPVIGYRFTQDVITVSFMQSVNGFLHWRMVSSALLRRVALVRTDVSEEPGPSFIRVTKISELGTTQAATSNRRTLRRNTMQLVLFLVHLFLSPWWRRLQVPPKRRFLQEPHGITTQKTPFFIVTAVKTSNLTGFLHCFLDFDAEFNAHCLHFYQLNMKYDRSTSHLITRPVI
jgi:hypothetical protein